MAKSVAKMGRIYEILTHETPQSAEDIRVVFTPVDLVEATLLFVKKEAGPTIKTDEAVGTK